MAISFVGVADHVAASAALPSFVAGDIALVFAYRDGNNTPPSLPAGWTDIASSGANTNSSRVGYRILQGGDTSSGTWTNATEIQILILRGQHSSPIGGSAAGGANNSTQISYSAVSFVDSGTPQGSSWVVGFAGHRTATDVNAKAVSGMTTRSGDVTSLGVHTAEAVGSFSASNYTTTVNASSGWRSYAVEVRATAAAKNTGTARISLLPAGVPSTRTAHELRVRARALGTVHDEVLNVRLYEGATTRSAILTTSTLTTSFVDYTLAIADSDAATIGSYSDLEVRVWGSSALGYAGQFEVSQLELALPLSTLGAQYGNSTIALTLGITTNSATTAGGAKSTGVARVSLAAGLTPSARTGHAVVVRARRTALQGTLRAQLYEGSTPRSALLETGELTTSLAQYTLSIDEADAATITSYADLELRLWGYSSTGTATVFEIADAQLILPASNTGGNVLGAFVLSATAQVFAGEGGVPVYPGTGIYPYGLISVNSVSTVSVSVSQGVSFGQVVLPLTVTQYSAGNSPSNAREGSVTLASVSTVSVAPAAVVRFGQAEFASTSEIVIGGGGLDVTGQFAISATATLQIAGTVPGVPLPPDFIASPFPQLPSTLLAIAFTTAPLSPFPTYAGVTSYLRGIDTRRGRQFELDRVEAGTESFLLDNRAGTFSPENTASPYYGNLIPTRKVRFALAWNSVVYDIFNGYLEGYPQEFPDYGFDAVVRQQAVDAFMPLAKGKLIPGSTTLTSPMLSIPSETTDIPLETIGVALTGLPMPQAVPFDIVVDSEVMTVTSIPSPNTYVVQRQAGTESTVQHTGVHAPVGPPVAHNAGAPVTTTAVSFAEEYSGTRIVNVLQRIGITPAEYDIDDGQTLLAPSDDLAGQNPLEHMNLVAEVEGGRFFAARDGRITFRDRHDQYKNEQSPRATFGDSTGEIHYSDVKPTHDAEKIRNVVRITAADGTVAEVRDEASITDHFEQVFEKVWPLADPNEALAAAQYILGRYSRMQIRVPEILVKGQENPTLDWPHLLALELGQRFRLIRRPTLRSGITGTTIDKEMLVEGVAHQVGLDSMQTRVQLSLADENTYWRLEVVGYGELDSTTRLAY